MSQNQSNNPLHGIKLQQIVEELVAHYGWEVLGQRTNIRCFQHELSVKSCLKFFRRTPYDYFITVVYENVFFIGRGN